MEYVSRKYLREKYKKLKSDMENVLQVLDEDLSDSIDNEDVKRVFYTIEDSSQSIIDELLKGMN